MTEGLQVKGWFPLHYGKGGSHCGTTRTFSFAAVEFRGVILAGKGKKAYSSKKDDSYFLIHIPDSLLGKEGSSPLGIGRTVL